jgi:UrcA family protein
MFRKTSALAATLLLTLATGSPALAEQITRIVHYHDLDLTTRTGTRTFRHRLQRAVNRVCRAPSPAAPLTGSEDQDCRAEVMAKVQPQMLVAIELAQTRAMNEVVSR